MVQSSGQALKERLGEKVPCEDCGSEKCECAIYFWLQHYKSIFDSEILWQHAFDAFQSIA
jgi:hypothetical protein